MRKFVYLFFCLVLCSNLGECSIFDVSIDSVGTNTSAFTEGSYKYSESIFHNTGVKKTKENSVQLYKRNTEDAMCNRGLLKHKDNTFSPTTSTSKSLAPIPKPNEIKNKQTVMYHYEDLPKVIAKIDKLNERLDALNKNILGELKSINTKFEVLNAQNHSSNIKEVSKKN